MKVSTKKDKNSAPVVTNLTVTGGSPATWQALGMQALVVKLQGNWRKNGIPESATINVDDYAPGTRHSGPVDVKAAITLMSKEEKAALLKQLQEMEG